MFIYFCLFYYSCPNFSPLPPSIQPTRFAEEKISRQSGIGRSSLTLQSASSKVHNGPFLEGISSYLETCIFFHCSISFIFCSVMFLTHIKTHLSHSFWWLCNIWLWALPTPIDGQPFVVSCTWDGRQAPKEAHLSETTVLSFPRVIKALFFQLPPAFPGMGCFGCLLFLSTP